MSMIKHTIVGARTGLGALGAALLIVSSTGTSRPAVILAEPDVPVFRDVSRSAGLVQKNRQSWGVAWADYDSDGYPDLYYGRHQGDKASLYRNLGNGTFADAGLSSGITIFQDRHECVWGDYDADHDIDLICTGGILWGGPWDPRPRLFRNNGDGTFTDIASSISQFATNGRWSRAASWLDYDNDGLLDLFNAGQSQKLALFRNLGGWPAGSFTNVALAAGVATSTKRPRSVETADYDNDGYWDIFVAAEKTVFMTTRQVWLYRALGNGQFQDTTVSAGVALHTAHSGAWGDYDNDGDVDLFVGGWVQPDIIAPLALYRNEGDGTFEDVTASAGIQQSSARMGVWGDFDSDGWQDLFVVNGSTVGDGINVPDQLYVNNGDGTFTEAAALAGVQGPSAGSGDGAAWADFNGDGFLDLAVANGGGWAQCRFGTVPPCFGPPKLYRNTPNGNHWLKIRLHADDDYFGYGSKVWTTTDTLTQYRQVTDGAFGTGQNEQVVHFGLGGSTVVDELTIRWPDGTEDILTDLAADQELVMTQ